VSLFHAIVLGIIQGLTEFLPVSSSGHLVLLQRFLGFQGPDVVFDTCFHLGTWVAVCLCFRKDIWGICRALWRFDFNSPSARLFLMILIGTIPTAIIGLSFRDFFEGLFSRVVPTAVMLLITGSLLFMADRVKTSGASKKIIRASDALIIGIVQGLAIIPGISRSGSTISTGIFIGLERQGAATFSFLLSIPSIAGAGWLQASDIMQLQRDLLVPLLVGTVLSAVTGYMAIKALLRFVIQRRLSFFSYYCWLVGCGVLLVSLIRIFGY
jgi:undecaprenyl-diphosphatase